MRFPLLVVAVTSCSTSIAPVVASAPPAPHAAAATAVGRAALSTFPLKTRLSVASSDASGSAEGLLPPKDETSGPIARFRELLAAPNIPDGVESRYERFAGIWRTFLFGFIPASVVTFKQGSKWILQEEAAGNIYQSWPRSVIEILGEKALINLSEQPNVHAIARKPLSEALSPKSVLELQPYLKAVLKKSTQRLEGFAESGQEVAMFDELTDFTIESITGVFFADYATPEVMEAVKRYMPTIVNGLFSFPMRFPWPLNKLALFSFGKSMDAREAFSGVICRVLEERRADIASARGGSSGTAGKSAGVLDALIEVQQGHEGTLDDSFIVDTVITSINAGTDTTASTLTRMLQLLATADDGKDITASLRSELSNEATTSDDNELDDTTGTGKGGASREGILGAFPLLDAVILETFRVHPAVNALFRKTKKDVTYNGYLIPEGQLITWNSNHQMRAPSLYPSPKKFCPFRFLHGDQTNNMGTAASSGPGGLSEKQPLPPMWGLGRHMCPGRELTKLEILMFLKSFLTKFDYELVKGQSFKGVLPTNGPKDKLRVVLKRKSVT